MIGCSKDAHIGTVNLSKKEEAMKNKILSAIMFLVVMLFVASAYAEDAKPAGTSLDDIKKMLGLSVYLQGGYTYNFKDPDSGENDLRVFDHQSNSFTFDLAQILFTKDAPVGGVGYRLKLSAGETAKFIHSRGLGEGTDAFDLTEAYIDYLAPLGKGLKLRFGKFVTMHGAEVIEAKDDMNYSRSFLFNYAIPFTHTGLMAGYAFSDQVSANIYVVNGWDNTSDNNNGKTFGLSVGYTPIDPVSLLFNVMYGPEKDNNNSDNRFLFDWVGTFKATKELTLVANTDYGTEEHSAADGGTAKWYGIAGYAKYDFSDLFSTTIRAEYFNDKDGIRTTVNGVGGIPQKLKEITITPEFRVAKAIIIRPEYRHDWSDQESFDEGSRKSQDTIALGVMYTW
jgi:hypothetical protein